MATRRRANTRAVALPARRSGVDVSSLLPTGRSILIGLALIVVATGAYLAARDTSVFAVQTVDVRGATPAVRDQVRQALQPELGRSLLRVGAGDLQKELAPITGVRSYRYDRAFPHTLTVTLQVARPVLVVRQGANAYLVSSLGRVLRTLQHPRLSNLPRLWIAKSVSVQVGSVLPPASAAGAIAVAPLTTAPLPGGVRMVSTGPDGLALTLGGGLQVRLGDTGDLRLKLAIARRILAMTGAASTGQGYLDVSVPERPVLSPNSQVGG